MTLVAIFKPFDLSLRRGNCLYSLSVQQNKLHALFLVPLN